MARNSKVLIEFSFGLSFILSKNERKPVKLKCSSL